MNLRELPLRFRLRSRRWIYACGPVLLIVAALLAATPGLIEPACPKHLTIVTGGAEGAYFATGERYREILARDGITLEVRPSAGSVENLDLLGDETSGVSLAIVQGGVVDAESGPGLQSLGSLYREPIWVVHRGDKPWQRLDQLRGSRIAVGPPGSGTRRAAIELLGAVGLVGNQNDSTKLLPITGEDAATALAAGDVDAVMLVVAPTAPLLTRLLEMEQIQVMNFRRAEAIARQFPYLSLATVGEGSLDLQANLPAQATTVLAPTANLVARDDLHPALVPLLIEAAREVHACSGLLHAAGEFPAAEHLTLPLSGDAETYYQSGPRLLYRWLPFRIAVTLDRMKLLLVPLLMLSIPLAKVALPLYRWRIRSKIYRWYRVLREIDQKLKSTPHYVGLADDIQRLSDLEHELAEVSVPLSYMEEFYNLRLHLDFIRRRLLDCDQQQAETQAQSRLAA